MDFKNKSIRLQEVKSKKWFRVKIDDVLEISTQQHDSELRKLKQNEYVLVYDYSLQSLHTVYVDKYDASTQMVECINSHGGGGSVPKLLRRWWSALAGMEDQFPSIRLQDIVKLYRVTCTAVDATAVPGIETLLKYCLNKLKS